MTRTRTQKKQKRGSAGPRRQRCTRCTTLKPPGELAHVGPRERLCEECLVLVGDETADAAGLPEAAAMELPVDVPEGSTASVADDGELEIVLDHGTLKGGVYTEGNGTLDAPEGSYDDTVGTQDEPPSDDALSLTPEQEEQIRVARLRIRELKMDEHVRMIKAGEHPPPPEPDGDDEEDRLLRRSQIDRQAEETRARLHLLPDVTVPGWPGRYGRVSASSLGTFSRCPEQWRRRYVLGERTPTGGPMLTGSALHGACEDLWHHKMATGIDLDEKAMTAAFQARFEYEIDDAGGAAWVEWGKDKRHGDLTGDVWRERGEAVALAYLRHVAPRVWPMSAERLFIAHVAGSPVPVVGYIDVTTADAKIDLKFGRSVKSYIGPDWVIQAHLYLLADDLPMSYQSLGWPSARDGSVNYRTPGDSPDLQIEKTAERYMIANQIVVTRVQQIMRLAETIGPDDPWPDALAHPWACMSCDFKPTCAHWHPQVVTL